MTSDRIRVLARQQLETELLLGLEFLPRPKARGDSSPITTGIAAESNEQALAELERRFSEVFPVCESLSGATQPVFGEGNPDADLVFIGEAPGADEDRLGRPFVGAAGRKLDSIISAMGFQRDQVYIANILKARPPGNRNPLPDEVAAHGPFLAEQLLVIRPRVIVALGRPAAHFLLDSTAPISRLRGQWGCWEHEGVSIDLMPTYHPAYILRQYTQEVRRQVWHDMQQVMAKLQES